MFQSSFMFIRGHIISTCLNNKNGSIVYYFDDVIVNEQTVLMEEVMLRNLQHSMKMLTWL